MRIGILQPGYLPWLGFFEQLYRTDVFVIYDDVQYDRNGWRNRNRIKTASGPAWLTVPVHASFSQGITVDQVKIDNTREWEKKHLLSIQQNYSRALFYRDYASLFEEAFSREWEYLVDLDLYFILKLKDCLGIGDRKIVRSSGLGITGDRIGRLIKICRHFGADVFYEGQSGSSYIDKEEFLKEGITVEFQDYKHPVYRQLHGEFVAQLSVVDLLFNHGTKSLGILLNQEDGGK
jgi:hypothetical protein